MTTSTSPAVASPPPACRRAPRGWRALGRAILVRSAHLVVAKDLGDPAPAARGRLRVVPFERAHAPGIERLAREPGLGSAVATMHFALEHGDEGVVALRGESVVGYAWYVSGARPRRRPFPHLARYGLVLGPGEAYLHNLVLTPGHRGDGRATEFLAGVHEHLRTRGIRRVYGFVEADNLAARTLYRILGWREIGRHPYTRLLRIVLILDGRLYVKNLGRRPAGRFDFRPLFAGPGGGGG